MSFCRRIIHVFAGGRLFEEITGETRVIGGERGSADPVAIPTSPRLDFLYIGHYWFCLIELVLRPASRCRRARFHARSDPSSNLELDFDLTQNRARDARPFSSPDQSGPALHLGSDGGLCRSQDFQERR